MGGSGRGGLGRAARAKSFVVFAVVEQSAGPHSADRCARSSVCGCDVSPRAGIDADYAGESQVARAGQAVGAADAARVRGMVGTSDRRPAASQRAVGATVAAHPTRGFAPSQSGAASRNGVVGGAAAGLGRENLAANLGVAAGRATLGGVRGIYPCQVQSHFFRCWARSSFCSCPMTIPSSAFPFSGASSR